MAMMNTRIFCLETNLAMSLRAIVDNITLLNSVDECVDLITDFENEDILLIASHTLLESIMPFIYDIPRLWGVFLYVKKGIIKRNGF